jgi:hypothetical protein
MGASEAEGGGFVDVFVSYAGPDRPWAEWAAWQLSVAGYSVELDVWAWSAGENLVLRISDALSRAGRVLALWSPAYFERPRFTTHEWTEAMTPHPSERRLVPVRVAKVTPPPILRPLLFRDLFGLHETQAREELLTAVGRPRRPDEQPRFPGAGQPGVDGPRVPGTLPAVWNVAPRNPAFTGRETLLAAARERLQGGAPTLALHGAGGVGKTQLAVEYAHLFAGDYQLVWWVHAERAEELIAEQFATLATRAGWVGDDVPASTAAQVALDRLRQMPRWLVVFDNAEKAATVWRWQPQGSGHVLVTSRSAGFAGVAVSVEVDVFTRAESMALLQTHLPGLAAAHADRLAEALGDLPLALAQAGALLAETGMTVPEYLEELDKHATKVLEEPAPAGYPAPLAAAVQLTANRLARADSAGWQLLQVFATLSPEPIPLAWFGSAPGGVLAEPLATVARSMLELRRTLGRLAGLGLARVGGETAQVHRLTQAVLRDGRTAEDRRADQRRAELLIAAAKPGGDGSDPRTWPAWAALLPHLLFLDPATCGDQLRPVACDALWYLIMRGQYHTALPLARACRQQWQRALSPNDPHVLTAASLLASAHRMLGHPGQARELDEDTLTRRRLALGEDHPDTLATANNLALDLGDLGEHRRARELNEDILARYRQVLGEDYPGTLTSAHNLAIRLRALDEHQHARELDEDTLTRRRQILGEDHPRTLTSAHNLAICLRALGEYQRARELDEDTLIRRRRILGEEHPDTVASAHNLAIDLRALGEH